MSSDSAEAAGRLRDDLASLLSELGRAETGDIPALRDLLDLCEERSATTALRTPEPIRTLHHFACSGGTLIAKALTAMPNTVVLNEIDPLSQQHLRSSKQPFFPTDLIAALRYSAREIDNDTILKVFAAALLALRDDLARQGCHLILRDHAHTLFCTDQTPESRPNLHRIVAGITRIRGLVTVRHPLDSFLSLQHNNWVHFKPGTLEEYCRRYLVFLDVHAGLPVHKYENFVTASAETVAAMCRDLALPFVSDFETLMPLARLSGDSGRSGQGIAPRPRRATAPPETGRSPSYEALCDRLGYQSDPAQDVYEP